MEETKLARSLQLSVGRKAILRVKKQIRNLAFGNLLKAFRNNLFRVSRLILISALLLGVLIPYTPEKGAGGSNVANAASVGQLQGQLNSINAKIEGIKGNLSQKRNEKATLENQIAILSGQIEELQLKIEGTTVEIQKTETEIAETEKKIRDTEAELQRQQEIIKEHLRILYEQRFSAVEVVVSSDNFSEFINKSEYLRTMQEKVQETAEKIKQLKIELETKKKTLETKRSDLGNLKKQLDGEKADLDTQRVQKDKLLETTKGEEAAYQAQLNDSKNAYAAVQSQINSVLASLRTPSSSSSGPASGSVKRGQVIGYQGNSGFSSGSHLHFGVYKGTADVDPMPYMNNGTFSWPLDNPTITQGYWGTFSHRGVGWPGGLDLSQYFGAPVHAAADGNIIFNGYNAGTFGHYIIMDHGNGLRTLYGHMQ